VTIPQGRQQLRVKTATRPPKHGAANGGAHGGEGAGAGALRAAAALDGRHDAPHANNHHILACKMEGKKESMSR
jgi:hypothetical protein